MAGNQYYTLLEDYMIHDSAGNEMCIYQSTEDGYFYLAADEDNRFMYRPKKELLDRFNLGKEFSEAILAHILKFG